MLGNLNSICQIFPNKSEVHNIDSIFFLSRTFKSFKYGFVKDKVSKVAYVRACVRELGYLKSASVQITFNPAFKEDLGLLFPCVSNFIAHTCVLLLSASVAERSK